MSKQLYIIECNGHYKIGISKNIYKRLAAMQTGNPYELKVASVYNTNNPYFLEGTVHLELKNIHVRGEWFKGDLDYIMRVISESSKIVPSDTDESIAVMSKQGFRKGNRAAKKAFEQRFHESKINPTNDTVRITKDYLRLYMTGGSGIPAYKARLLGLSYPTKRGWKKTLIGKVISVDTHEELLKPRVKRS